jgi:hypothetical protein
LHMWLSICTFLQNIMALYLSVFELCWFKKKIGRVKTGDRFILLISSHC